jgi:hypothetical protein
MRRRERRILEAEFIPHARECCRTGVRKR